MTEDFNALVHLKYKKIVDQAKSSLKEFSKISDSKYNDLIASFEKDTTLTPEQKEKFKQELIDSKKDMDQGINDDSQAKTKTWLAQLEKKMIGSLKERHKKSLKKLEEKGKKLEERFSKSKKGETKSKDNKKIVGQPISKLDQKSISKKTFQVKTKKMDPVKPTRTTTKVKNKLISKPKDKLVFKSKKSKKR